MGIQIISDIPLDQARSAIYAVVHRDSGRIYIGRTSGTVARRWEQHLYDALERPRTKHYLAGAIRKYGAEAFDVIALAHGLPAETLARWESFYVELLEANVYGKGFNLTAGGEVAPSSDPRVRQKISEAQIGRVIPPQHRAKLSAALLGKKKSPEAVAKWAEKRRGTKFSLEWRRALSEAHKGHVHSEEHKAKIADSNRRRHAATGIGKQQGEKMRVVWANPEYKSRVAKKISAGLLARRKEG